jgi:hypothetical protein
MSTVSDYLESQRLLIRQLHRSTELVDGAFELLREMSDEETKAIVDSSFGRGVASGRVASPERRGRATAWGSRLTRSHRGLGARFGRPFPAHGRLFSINFQLRDARRFSYCSALEPVRTHPTPPR